MPMRRVVYLSLIVFVAVSVAVPVFAYAEVEAPHEIAGFRLQDNIDLYRDRIEKNTAAAIRDMEYLGEVDVIPPAGFKSGYLVFGKCAHPGRVVRISMKYADSSKELFDKLLDRFKEEYGEPAEWRGDPFHVYVAWKWSLVDKDNNRISMILQHYSGDEDVYKNGNSVKLSMFELVEQEEKCYDKKHPQAQETTREKSEKQTQVDFNKLIPGP